jgi:hypothetical protein
MSKRVYTTANGRHINIDTIIAQNEETIAVGNMKTNARGDELGPGGRIERKRNEVMSEYYKLNTPVATDNMPVSHKQEKKRDLVDDWVEPVVEQLEPKLASIPEVVEPAKPVIRGSLAGSIAKTQPATPPEPKKTGPSRI